MAMSAAESSYIRRARAAARWQRFWRSGSWWAAMTSGRSRLRPVGSPARARFTAPSRMPALFSKVAYTLWGDTSAALAIWSIDVAP